MTNVGCRGDAQPDKFGSIPRSMWWAAVTLTTIGYGDVYPITVAGKVIAVLVAVAGIGLIAMPAGILAAAFSDAMIRSRKPEWLPVKSLLLSLVLLLPASAAWADPCRASLPMAGTAFGGTVQYVGDGDSICVGTSNSPNALIEMRVADFYAPELHSSQGPAAKAAMQQIAMGRNVQCIAGRRSYDRVVARCTLNGVSLGDLMRRAGVSEGGNGR